MKVKPSKKCKLSKLKKEQQAEVQKLKQVMRKLVQMEVSHEKMFHVEATDVE